MRCTDGGDADGPLLMVELGRVESLPPEPPEPLPPDVLLPVPLPDPAPPVGDGTFSAELGADEVPGPGAAEVGGATAEDVAGAVLTLVVSVGASALSLLPQPASKAADAMADAAKSAAPLALYVMFMARG